MIADRQQLLRGRIGSFVPQPARYGRVTAFDGTLVTVAGVEAAPGILVTVMTADGPVMAQAIGFRDGALLLVALQACTIEPGAVAILEGRADAVAVGAALAGRVVDPMGRPLDGGPLPATEAAWPLEGRPLPPLSRAEVDQPLETGIRAIDGLFTLGRGQRVGLIAGSGVGKSVLMQQLVRGAVADRVVVALVGERGREIAGFIAELSPDARARTHLVAAPADAAAPLKLRAARSAFAVAESWRAQGLHVLLLLDSLTRVAHAQRELGLALGEPVGMKGYPASALALIPRLVERAGNDSRTGGAITALFTVLADGDDVISDPVVDTARGVLDGHLILDRTIAARGRFPAIDLAYSVSRTMSACATPEHLAAATALRRDSSLVESNRDLVAMGAYSPGQDPLLDRGLARQAAAEAFLAQGRGEHCAFDRTVSTLVEGWGQSA